MKRTGIIEGAANFTYEELVASSTAEARGIDNTPTDDAVWENLAYLARTCLQPIRDEFGPVVVSSGYRGPALNKAVGGSATSHHCNGCAADIHVPGAALKDVFAWIVGNLPFTELIAENIGASMWIHVAVVKGRERECATKYMRVGGSVRKASASYILSLDW